jgi:signal transduction histidine kinase
MIIFKARALADSVEFAVIDTGPGIAQDKQVVIFEPFIQTETGIKHAGGTGLGLPISKRLAEVHGGSLWVESKPGTGAAFFVVLPYVARVESLNVAG